MTDPKENWLYCICLTITINKQSYASEDWPWDTKKSCLNVCMTRSIDDLNGLA